MISTRFVPAVGVLTALALVPTLIHSYADDFAVDGFTTAAVPATLAGYSGASSTRGAKWGKQRFDSDDWIERLYTRNGDAIRLTIVRSYDAKTLYHHPELAIAYGSEFGTTFGSHEVKRLPSRPEIAVHVLRPAADSTATALYVLHYDDEFVENPIWFQVRTAGALLFSRRLPMTLFFANDLETPPDETLDKLPATTLLVAAIESFLEQAPTRDSAK